MSQIEEPKINHLLSRRRFFGVLFFFILILFLVLIWPYLNVVIFSLTIVMVLHPIYNRIYAWKWVRSFRAGRGLATALTIIGFTLIVAIPVAILAILTITQVRALSSDIKLEEFVLKEFLEKLLAGLERLVNLRSIEFDRQAFVEAISNAVRQVLTGLFALIIKIGASFPRLLINGFLFFGFLATLLPTFDSLLRQVRSLIPLENPIVEAYATKIYLMTRSMFVGIFVLSFVQGIAMGVVYVLAGIPYAAFWTALSIAFSVLPLVGISFIVLPMSIILFLNGDATSAIIVLVGFYGFANWIDTLLRPKLVPKGAYLHPLLLMLSVFGGLALAGFFGVIYGPVIMIVFVTTIELYRTYFLGIGKPEEVNNELASLVQ